MKKLYDEIMAEKSEFYNEQYGRGFNDGINKSAELAKKYDDEIERLNKLIDQLLIVGC